MSTILDPLLADGVIDEVLGRLKSGKEADIWLVRRGQSIVAAKVYKDRDRRSFKNNAEYKEGRDVRNSRTRRAIESGSTFGREAEEQAWKAAEADALNLLHASGVRVPRPVLFSEGVLLMEVVVGTDGQPASRLIDVPDLATKAQEMYRDLRGQIIRMLCAEIIHGDLSAYNILAGIAGPTIIDFPQIVSPSHNSRAEFFFLRDFQNVLQFLGSHDPAVLAFVDDGQKIWNAYARRHLTPDFRPSAPGSEPRGGGAGGDRRGGRPAHPQQAPRPQQPPRHGRAPSWQPAPARIPQPARPPQQQPPRPAQQPPRPPHPQQQRPPRPQQQPQRTPHPRPADERNAPALPREARAGMPEQLPQSPDARAPGEGGKRRRRRRRGRGGAPGGPGPNPQQNAGGSHSPAGNASPRPPNGPPRPHDAPRPHAAPRGPAAPKPAAAPKLPGWLQNAKKKGGGGPRISHPNEKKPFRRRKRRF